MTQSLPSTLEIILRFSGVPCFCLLVLLGAACGNGEREFTEAKKLRNGEGVAKDEKGAAELFAKACEKGFAEACANLAFQYEDGAGVPKDAQRAVELYRIACQKGVAIGCHNLGVDLGTGVGVEKNVGEAAAHFKTACDSGYAPSCAVLGDYYAAGTGLPKDDAKAKEMGKRACDGGVITACFILGTRTNDLAEAATLFKVACEKDHARACHNLGIACDKGKGVEKNSELAATLFAKACKLGLAQSCVAQGVLLQRNGRLSDALTAFKTGCEAKDPDGCKAAAAMLHNSEGVDEKDDAAALVMFKKGCDLGDADSCNGPKILDEANRQPTDSDVAWATRNAGVVLEQMAPGGVAGAPRSALVAFEKKGAAKVFVVLESFNSRINYCVTLRQTADGKLAFNHQFAVLNCHNPPTDRDIAEAHKWNASMWAE